MPESFNETTDLYLQLLRKAQEVEDPRLVGMILERLKDATPHLAATHAGGAVIPFPIGVTWSDPRPAISPFWPRMGVAQVGCLVAFYALLVVGHALFG